MKIIKVRKRFNYKGVELRLVDSEEYYMNGRDPLIMKRVVTPNDHSIPINFSHRQTLKSMVEQTIAFLDNTEKRGFDVVKELNK
jgi:hypothetical protein